MGRLRHDVRLPPSFRCAKRRCGLFAVISFSVAQPISSFLFCSVFFSFWTAEEGTHLSCFLLLRSLAPLAVSSLSGWSSLSVCARPLRRDGQAASAGTEVEAFVLKMTPSIHASLRKGPSQRTSAINAKVRVSAVTRLERAQGQWKKNA